MYKTTHQKRINNRVSALFILVFCTFLSVFLFGTTNSIILAQDPDIERDSNMEINYSPESDFVTVTNSIAYKINDSQVYYDASAKLTFLIQDYKMKPDATERAFKKSTLAISDSENNNITDFTITEKLEGIELKIGRNRQITSYSPYEVKIQYKTHELLSIKGNITSIYIPGISKDQEFHNTESGILTQLSFNVKVIVPESTSPASEISPSTIKEEFVNQKKVYSINGSDLIGKMGWIQFCTQQYNYFKIVQIAPKTDFVIPIELSKLTNLLSTNIYKIVLPRDYSETNQKVYYKNISPKPTRIETDTEGNIVATFEVPANETTEIVAEGYISIEKVGLSNSELLFPDTLTTDYILILQDKNLSSIDYSKYTNADTYWQKDALTIKAASDKLQNENPNLRKLILADYKFVIDSLEYDYAKIETNNPRLGAVEALNTEKGVCMEYADLLIAIFRAQGIPARAAFGYGNDPLLSNSNTENINTKSVQNTRIGHQWVQVWIENIGWISIDPTWGETEREYLGPDLDHILWSAASDLSKNTIYDIYLFSADKITSQSLNSFDITLRTVKKSEFETDFNNNLLNDLTFYSPITSEIENKKNDEISRLIKTTPLGKSIVIILPSCFALILLMLLLTTGSKLIKRSFEMEKKSLFPKKLS